MCYLCLRKQPVPKETNDITLQVEGMTCVNCAKTVTKTIERSGGANVDVNFATGEANFIVSNPEDLDTIKKEINNYGYQIKDVEEIKAEENTHGHTHDGKSKLEKHFYLTLFFTIPLFSHMFLPFVDFLQNPIVQLILCLPVLYIGIVHFGKSAFTALKNGSFHMDVLIFIGSNAAFVYSLAGTWAYWGSPEVHNYLFYETSATIITLVLMGNLLEQKSVQQTTTAISELSQIRAKKARKMIGDSMDETIEIEYDAIQIGDKLIINTGDKVPIDGKIIWGEATLDESMITGESVPVERGLGEPVIGGTTLSNGSIRIEATTVGEETILSKIIELVKRAQQNKPNIQKLGDQVSEIFVPAVLTISAGTFLISYFAFDIPVGRAMMSAIAVLVISCPCAMGLATPTAVIAGIGRAAKQGILIKGGGTLEEFAKIKHVVFDKTGTLTTGNFKIKSINTQDEFTEQWVKNLLFSLEQHSSHPIAQSLVRELKDSSESLEFSKVQEDKGIGMHGILQSGEEITLGSQKIWNKTESETHSLYLLINKKLMATIDIQDEVKSKAKEMVTALHGMGIKTVMLSGDSTSNCDQVAQEVGITEVYSEQTPDQKLEIISKLAAQGHTAMVGDGVNDAPALSKATVGISLGNATQVAIDSSQIVLLNAEDLTVVHQAFQISRHTYITIKQNLFWAFAYNIVAIPIAAMGMLNPMVGALAMAFSDVIVIGNSIRLKTKRI